MLRYSAQRLLCAPLAAALLFAAMAHAQTSTTARTARDVSVNSQGPLWIIAADGNANSAIQRVDGANVTTLSGAAVRIAADNHGAPWVVNSNGDLYHWEKDAQGFQNWKLYSNVKAMDVAVGPYGRVWIVGTDHRIMTLAGGQWQALPGGGDRIAVDPHGNPWITNAGNDIWRYNGTSWELLPGKAQDIAIAPDGTVYVLGMQQIAGGFQPYRWEGKNWQWFGTVGGIAISATNQGPIVAQMPQVVQISPPTVISQPVTVSQPIILQGSTSTAVGVPVTNPIATASAAPPTGESAPGVRKIFWRDQGYEAQMLKALQYGMYGSQIWINNQAPPASSLPPLDRGFAKLALITAEAYYAGKGQNQVTADQVLREIGNITDPTVRRAIYGDLGLVFTAKMTDRSNDAETVALRAWGTQLFRLNKIALQKASLDEYYRWKADPCGYEKKAPGECKTLANLFTTRTPPNDMIASNALGNVLSNNSAQVAAATGLAAGAIGATAASAALASALGTVVIEGTTTLWGTVIGQVSTSLFAAFGGTGGAAAGEAAAIGAAGWGGVAAAPIAAVIMAVVVGTTEGFKVVEAARVEPMLKLKLGAAMTDNIVIDNALVDANNKSAFYLAFQNAAANRFILPPNTVNGEIRYYNQGGYVARMTGSYILNGARSNFSTPNLAVGRDTLIVIPAAATSITLASDWTDGITWHNYYNGTLAAPTYICYTSYGTIFQPAMKTECPEISNIQGQLQTLTVTQGGGYVARVRVTYTQNGREIVAIDNSDLGAGWRQEFKIPADATNIHLQAWDRTGLVWEPWKSIIDTNYPSPPNVCIKVYGTTLDPKWNNECN